MSEQRNGRLRTPLRQTYERARGLPPEAQLQECVDQLEHPDVLVSEFVESYCAVEAHMGTARVAALTPAAAAADDGDADELVLEYFYAGREISVCGGSSSAFTCLASDVQPLWGMQPGGDQRDGLDYVGLGRAPGAGPVLGAVQSALDATPFLVLLRLLACAAELAPKPQCQRLDREIFDGRAGAEPVFDLHLVLWEDAPGAAPQPLHELTRDLAEMVKLAALDDPLFPQVLGDIHGLRMDPDAFEGMLRHDWRV